MNNRYCHLATIIRRWALPTCLTVLIGLASVRAADVEKIIFIGDSITEHSPSVEKLGWSGNYGMAASSANNDYVHLFVARLTQEQRHEPDVSVYARGGGTLSGQMKFLDDFRNADAQVAVVQMGENDKLEGNGNAFLEKYKRILETIHSGNPNCRIFCFEVWSPPSGSLKKDQLIRQACEEYGATVVSLKAANANPLNKALSENRFTHPGVNWHPGDRGMQAMADALWAAYMGEDVAPPDVEPFRPNWSLHEDWSTPSAESWTPVPPVSHGRAQIIQTKPAGSALYHLDLPSDAIKGGILLVQTRVKAEDVSEKPQAWNGIKLTIRLQNAEGDISYPQYHLPEGTYDWTPIQWELIIPDNIVDARLTIGLEKVTGSVWFDELAIAYQ